MKTHSIFFLSSWSPRMRKLAALASGSLVAVTGAASCGGDDLSCGTGTKKSGSKCVAVTEPLEAGDGSGGADGDGGGSGGAAAGGKGTAGALPDGGEPNDDVIAFAGVTAAAPADETSVLVTWKEAAYARRPDAILHYEIFTAETAGGQNFSASSADAPPGATSYLVQGLEKDKTYYFTVRAVADRGSAKDTNEVEKSAAPALDETAPTFDGVGETSPSGARSVLVKWEAATDDMTPPEAMTYRVAWSDSSDGTLQVGAVSAPGATEVVVSGLPEPESPYYFNVVAVDAAGNVSTSAKRASGETGTDETAPIFGGCSAVTKTTAGGGNIVWEPAVDDATVAGEIEYRIYAFEIPVTRETPFEDIEPVGTATGVTSLTVTGLKSATHYRFVCRAADEKGNEDQNRRTLTVDTLDDGVSPTFEGITEETHGATDVLLKWKAGEDNLTEQQDLTYAIYGSLTSPLGEEDFSRPIAISDPGDTERMLQKGDLSKMLDGSESQTRVSNRQYYFVVRAMDLAGNTDENVTEVAVKTLVSFRDDVEFIMSGDDTHEAKCAKVSCHSAADPTVPPQQGQNLDKGSAYANIVNVPAQEAKNFGLNDPQRNLLRVDPRPYNPDTDLEYSDGDVRFNTLMKSYLWRKISGTRPFFGNQMPAAGFITEEERATVTDWILQGAQDN